MQWSVEEQTIRSTKPVTLTSIVLRVDTSQSQHCIMEMHGDDPAKPYDVLKFDRNGAFISIEAVEPAPPPTEPAPPPTEPEATGGSSHAAHGKKK
jgi:hypothetical protein